MSKFSLRETQEKLKEQKEKLQDKLFLEGKKTNKKQVIKDLESKIKDLESKLPTRIKGFNGFVINNKHSATIIEEPNSTFKPQPSLLTLQLNDISGRAKNRKRKITKKRKHKKRKTKKRKPKNKRKTKKR